MSRPIILGFLGRGGSGKTTAAQHVVNVWGAERRSFAGPLKKLAKLLWSFTDEQVYGTQAQKETIDTRWGITPRAAMIALGDGARETIGKQVWMDACFNQILEEEAVAAARITQPDEVRKDGFYIIDDVRYPNEVASIVHNTRFHGFVVKLVCPDSDSSSLYTQASSERSVDDVPEELLYATITSMKSTGSADLKIKVEELVSKIIHSVVDDNHIPF